MFKYKRGINELETQKQIQFVSSNRNIYMSMSSNLDIPKPFNGLYIKGSKVIIPNVIEKFESKDKIYRMSQFKTSTKIVSCDEYITAIDLENLEFKYDLGDVEFIKKIAFLEDEILCIKYEITNKINQQMKFKLIPMVTYRELFEMKKADKIRLNQRKVEDGLLINLSVMNQENIVIKTKEMKYTKEARLLNNLKHEYTQKNYTKATYNEDVLLPGEFETSIKAKETKNILVYISSKDIDISSIDKEQVFADFLSKRKTLAVTVADEYVELKELSYLIENFYSDDSMFSTLPYESSYPLSVNKYVSSEKLKRIDSVKEDIENLTNIVKSIDGQYLTFGQTKKTTEVLHKIHEYIEVFDNIEEAREDTIIQRLKLKLWFVESANRLFQLEDKEAIFIEYIKKIIYAVFKEENIKYALQDIELISLTYNAVKIYEYSISKLGYEDGLTYKVEEKIKNLIETKFWSEENRVMRENITKKECIATAKMLYTMSLSYPCIVGDVQAKLLDTIFKELYTPYGLRKVSKNSSDYDGLIYPKYMAHFVKANLRQNGVTRASQKIAYNLVKELIQDIGKYVDTGVKKIYSEKGFWIDSIGYDLLTNAEVIRLYNMLT